MIPPLSPGRETRGEVTVAKSARSPVAAVLPPLIASGAGPYAPGRRRFAPVAAMTPERALPAAAVPPRREPIDPAEPSPPPAGAVGGPYAVEGDA